MGILNIEIENEIARIGINRPEKRNALNDEVILLFEDVFRQISPTVKCAVIYGMGKHFSAGLDLSELKERDVVEGVNHSRMWHRVLNSIEFSKVPVVSALHGAVVGGGLELACSTHIRVADKSTFYALPEGQRGIFVGGGGSVRIPKLIGTARMQDMMLTGRVYTADEGQQIGISQYLVENDPLSKAMELAEKICTNAPMTNYAVTHVLPNIQNVPDESGFMLEALIAAIAQGSPEAKKRLKDFLDGRAKKVKDQ